MAITDDRPRAAARNVPYAMRDPLRVPRERYYSREFFELEKEYLWPRVWQMACRLEEVPEPGDYTEYEICDQSVLIVRQPDRSVKAFYNTCRHRATQLCKGTGQLRGGQIVCPFHGWRWGLDGTSTFVYGVDGFAAECLRPDDIGLQECGVGTWGGCVWVNLDPKARPLEEALAPAAQYLDAVGVDKMRVWYWKETIVNANWKIAQEAFHEGYHVMATHPQLTFAMGDRYPYDQVEYTAFPNGHGRFQGRFDPNKGGVAQGRDGETFIARSKLIQEGQDAQILERDIRVFEGMRHKVPPGEDFPTEAVKALLDYYAGAGIPFTTTPEAARLWGGEIFLFPNYFMLPMYVNSLAYRFRPYQDDPEWCRFEVWSLTTYPEGDEPSRPTKEGPFATDDADNLGQIPRQDLSNMQRQQKGLHARSYEAHRLATEFERIIRNMHEELDRTLAG